MRRYNFKHPPEHVLEMLYHRHLGYGLGDQSEWEFGSALRGLGLSVSDNELRDYRSYFIEHGWGQFDGTENPAFKITDVGQEAARLSIARRYPLWSARRLKTYDWSFYAAISAVIAALFAIATFFQGINSAA